MRMRFFQRAASAATNFTKNINPEFPYPTKAEIPKDVVADLVLISLLGAYTFRRIMKDSENKRIAKLELESQARNKARILACQAMLDSKLKQCEQKTRWRVR